MVHQNEIRPHEDGGFLLLKSHYVYNVTHGGVPKWLKGLVLKTGSRVTPGESSNPSASAIEISPAQIGRG